MSQLVSPFLEEIVEGGKNPIRRKTMKLVHTDEKLQEKSTARTHPKSIETQKIANLYTEVCAFINNVERAWQAAERVQAALEKYDPEACKLPEPVFFELE